MIDIGKTLEEELALEGRRFQFFKIDDDKQQNIRIPNIYPMDTVRDVKEKIFDKIGLPVELMDLKLDGRSLVDSKAFSYEITRSPSDAGDMKKVMIEYKPNYQEGGRRRRHRNKRRRTKRKGSKKRSRRTRKRR